ncbi:AAA family ATPase [Vibrio parahaemolyticus]|nr:AAA family ATPase [Vibrio parahaemolyticus]EJS9606127.1 AAA family ATPase [Vibrio parahaemolyticus]
MKAIRVRNLRSFANDESQPFVELKPLTIFVGKNSCGKSSLLRTLPLLRQSVEERTSGPILWYGTYADFGMFHQAKHKYSKEDIIYFDLKLDNDNYDDIVIKLGVTVYKKHTKFHTLSIDIGDNNLLFEFDNISQAVYTLNNEAVTKTLRYYLSENNFLPSLFYHSNSEETEPNYFEEFCEILFSFYSYIEEYDDDENLDITDFYDEVSAAFSLSVFTSPKTLIETIDEELAYFLVKKRSIPSEIEDKLFKLYLKFSGNDILSKCNKLLLDEFKGIRYIAPLRATAERYYRFQDFHINELDHTGSNLAMLLRSLSPKQAKFFQHWTDKNFGFKVYIKEEGLHYEIMVEIDGSPNNVSDMGFGFSQILPIVTSLWAEQSNILRTNIFPSNEINKTFVIEQPELHLHPELQARLASVFLKVATAVKRRNSSTKIIFETHSKTMINAIGDEIEENPELRDKVNIVIFNKEDTETNVKSVSFDEYGDLVDWPIGFFSGR